MHFNLADPGNTDFRARVLTGAVQPATLLRMLPQDMASEARPIGSMAHALRLRVFRWRELRILIIATPFS